MAAADAIAGRIPIGILLREWRKRRKLSQLDLALEADVSSRHICFLETGRARPSREMVLHLSNHLEIPRCERNSLLLSAGYAPLYPEQSYDSRAVSPTRDSLDRFLRAHEPYPAVLLRMQGDDHELAFLCTTSTLVTAPEITLTDLTTIAFYPGNATTAGRLLRDVMGSGW
jgi:transcriptional regulator with XRE-family HTH domain